MAQHGDTRFATLYQLVISVIVIAILLGTLIYYGTSLSSSVDTLTKDRAVDEFQRTAAQVRAKWLAKKQNVIELAKVNDQLQHLASVRFTVNQFGWPTGVLSAERESACNMLFYHLQAKQAWPSLRVTQVEENSQILECEYYLHERLWFTFDTETGKLRLNNN